MYKFKLVNYLVFTLLIVLAISACSTDSESASNNSNDGGDDSVEIKIAGQYEPDHPESKLIETFKEEVEDKTDGRVEVTTYPANQLGDYSSVYEEIMKGTVEMGLINVPDSYDPRNNILYLPYLTTGFDEAEKLNSKDSTFYKFLEDVQQDADIKFLGFNSGGLAGVFTTKEVNKPTDSTVDKEVNVRVASTEATRLGVEDMGFETTTIEYDDLFTSLQTGLVDGADGLDPMEFYTAFDDIGKHYYAYNNFYNMTAFLMNLDLWNELSEEDQEIIDGVIDDLTEEGIEQAKNNQEEYIQKIKDAGIEVVEFSDEELEEISNHVRNETWPKVEDEIGADVVEELIDELE